MLLIVLTLKRLGGQFESKVSNLKLTWNMLYLRFGAVCTSNSLLGFFRGGENPRFVTKNYRKSSVITWEWFFAGTCEISKVQLMINTSNTKVEAVKISLEQHLEKVKPCLNNMREQPKKSG